MKHLLVFVRMCLMVNALVEGSPRFVSDCGEVYVVFVCVG